MALEKDIIEESGVVSKYHKIVNFEVNFILKECVIYIADYINDTFRNKEKDLEKLKTDVDSLYSKYESETSDDIKNALLEKINSIDVEDRVYYTNIDTIHLDYIPEDLSYSSLYKIVGNIDKYKSSSNV